MQYTTKKIAEIVNGKLLQLYHDAGIEHLLLDSRKTYAAATSVFFALKGPRRDGHLFIQDLYKKGVRNFVISKEFDWSLYPDANIISVPDSLDALQQLAAVHRQQFDVPVIGITGSNGKTIVKEWLYQLLHEDFSIVRSPKSYNSQIGVPLSVWQMSGQHTLGIFEAGISQPGEMKNLVKIIQPTIGILTAIGEAHSEGFVSSTQKLSEKIKLFADCKKIIYCRDHTVPEQLDLEGEHRNLFRDDAQFYSWSKVFPAWLTITDIKKQTDHTDLFATRDGEPISISISFTDDASVENAITCWCTLLALGYTNLTCRERLRRLQPVNMRLELKKGINHCSIINDSYSADLSSLKIALNFLNQQSAGIKKAVILSDFLQSGLSDDILYRQIAADLMMHRVDRVIGIGPQISTHLSFAANYKPDVSFFIDIQEFIQHFRSSQFKDETILVKGARIFEFENIVRLLEQKVHETVLEISIDAIVHNLKAYQKLLQPETKIMAMVKAFAYGSGGVEIAGVLQYHKVDYLGVAYTDEGVEIRKAGITLPVMVLNPEESSFDAIIEHNLEPDIYSFETLKRFDLFLQNEGLSQYPVHIEIETGMNRLGFAMEEAGKLAEYLHASPSFKVQTIFTHLAGSEDENEDGFTREQFSKFQIACSKLENKLGQTILKHISNSAAIVRLPEMQMDMVRLGIGLYGIDSADTGKLDLLPVASLKSTIAQLKHLKKGESVSYNRKGIVSRDSTIATVRIGYADGYSRKLGNGSGKMLVNGKPAPVIGTVCMDMTMIDVTDIEDVNEGDDVIIFGTSLPVQQLAGWAGTIPYEIMTGISQRVKRVYFEG
ncbi:MAG: UDP-N-acetylmuramoyl-tripeptide--D-alanyl-D-alanine ligase [Chitinophagaceae bacterium]|nr:UDP-N-acetylmuramoyl-tripeptide--D-alanyl-D-alanine ligase [Chitinophagaceae bacterium]